MIKKKYILVWDLDDTIYQQSEQFNKSTNKLLGKSVFKGQEGYEIFKKYSEITFEEYKNGLFDTDEMRIERIIRTMSELGYSINKDVAILWQEYYLDEQYSLKLSKKMESILNECIQNNIELGLITNGPSEHQRKKIEALNLIQWIPSNMMIVSGDDEIHKPDQRIFKKFSNIINNDKKVIILEIIILMIFKVHMNMDGNLYG